MITVSKPYNHGVSTVTLNRILLILGLLGMFVAGVLTIEHRFQLEIPCTAGGGCEIVAKHPSSYLMGIPIAYFGFAGYVLLTGLAIIRGFTGQYFSKFLTISGYAGSAFGMVASLYLQYISFTVIGAKCVWCMTSALIMIITFGFYTVLFGRLNSPESDEPAKPSIPFLYQGIVGILIANLAVAGVTYGRNQVGNVAEIMDLQVASHLVPEPRSMRNQLGPDDAPATLVEYADLCCPQCRKSFAKIHELISKYPGKIRIVYRHFPIYQLAGHEQSLRSIIAAELAGEKGKFWEFADAFTAAEEAPKTPQGVDAIAATVGITTEMIEKSKADENSRAQKNLTRDFEDALGVFKISGTPTYLLYAKGQPVKKLTLVGVMNELESTDYQKIMKQP